MPELLTLGLDEIIVTRRREREELGDIDGLAQSLLQFGQLQPIVVDENNELIAGFRRMTATQQNGQNVILAIRKKDIDEALAKELELEENLQRKDMTTKEKIKGLAELDRLRRAKNPNWTQQQTAAVAGGKTSQRDVSIAVQLDKAMELFPEIGQAKSIAQAKRMLEAKVASVTRVLDVRKAPQDFSAIEEKFLLGDSVEVIKAIPDESFHAIITDPPFGVDYEDQAADSIVGQTSSYEDDKEKYLRILSMIPDMYRVLKPNSFCIFFLGFTWYEYVKKEFRKAGFTVDEIPIIWDRSDGRTFTNRPDRWFTKGYDIALHCIKGSPRLAIQGKSNIIRVPPVPSSEREILVERPVELYAELIRRTTVEGEVVADFFGGGGGCPAACASLKRGWLAVEKDESRRARGLQKVKANTPEK